MGKREKRRLTRQRGKGHQRRTARPFPAHAVVGKHEDFKSRFARRDDPLSRLLARATGTETTSDGRGLIKGVLPEEDHRELLRLLQEGREKYAVDLRERVGELRALLAQLHPVGVLARLMAINVIGFWGEYYEPTATGSEARVEFVAGLLSTTTLDGDAKDPPPADAIQRVIDLTDEIFDLSSLLNLSREASDSHSPEAEVRYAARAEWLHIRGAAYPQHALNLAHAIFDKYSGQMRESMGFNLDDVVALEAAVTGLAEARYNALLEAAFEHAPEVVAAARPLAHAHPEQGGPHLTDSELERSAFIQVWDSAITPALSFAQEDVRDYAPDLAPEAVQAMLERFTIQLGSLPAEDFSSPLNHNPLAEKPFVEWNGRYMLPVPGMIARDFVGLLEGDLLDLQKGFSKWRAGVVDDLSLDHLVRVLPGAEAHKHVYYPWAEDGEERWPECDGLILYDTVAVVVEGKGSRLSSAALRGDTRRARADLQHSLAEAGQQADRVAEYLRSHDPAIFYGEDRHEVVRVDTGRLERIHVILPTLHQLADYGLHPERLAALGLPHGGEAWAVYVNDLRIIADTVNNPAELLHYLVWRSRLPLGERIHVVDEIDLFGSYLLRQQLRELEEGSSTFIALTGSSTDFDDYYLAEIGHGPPAKRPELFSIPLVNRFLARLARDKPLDWLEAAGVCIDLSLGELAAVKVLVPRLLQAAGAGEVLWERFERCLILALGPETRWQSAWETYPGERSGLERVVFADRKKGKPRLVWAIYPNSP